MSDVIKLLPDSVANQIAAGEVIQRPASVIKELVENAIDAGSSEVQIILKDAGRTLIQVIDNGCGMSDTDARLAFERHSTSKIRKADDLFSLVTMGFRGEALASIAAIAQVELRTYKEGTEIGSKIEIEASKCVSQEPVVCAPGSNFMIKNIFFNVPARRKFLKNNQVELSNIVKEFERLALVNYSIDFTMQHNDTTMYKLLGGSIKQRIVGLFGHSLENQLMPIKVETSLVKIEGFIGRPENARKRNYLQYMFVNGRYMRHPYFHKAIVSCYEQLIPGDTQPNYFLYFKVEPDTIDVNIHPTKTEIKFENEVPIWQIIVAAVKEALGKFSAVPSIDFNQTDAPEIPFMQSGTIKPPTIPVDQAYNPFKEESRKSFSGSYRKQESSILNNWDSLYSNFSKSVPFDEVAPQDTVEKRTVTVQSSLLNEGEDDNEAISLMQIANKYILVSEDEGLLLIDQHRAHLQVLFEKYMNQMTCENIVSQRVLFPEIISLSVTQSLILESVEQELTKLGFVISNMGNNDWAINGTPVGFEGVDTKEIIVNVIDSIENGGESVKSKMFEHLALTVANSASIPSGRALSIKEMNELVRNLRTLKSPTYTADGKTIISRISTERITKLFN